MPMSRNLQILAGWAFLRLVNKMRKYLLVLVFCLIAVAACTQQNNSEPIKEKSSQTGQVKEFKMTAKQFAFEPEIIEANKGDKVRLIVTSVDVPHGLSIPEYGINERLNPGKTVTVEFTADKTGSFTAFCSVFCGAGHSKMRGKIVVT